MYYIKWIRIIGGVSEELQSRFGLFKSEIEAVSKLSDLADIVYGRYNVKTITLTKLEFDGEHERLGVITHVYEVSQH